MRVDTTKACQDIDIPTKILKENADIFDFLLVYYVSVVNSSNFSSILTPADIIPVFKKEDKECKNNYRPVNILLNMSNIFERTIFREISDYMKSFLSMYMCGFRKGYSTHHCLLFKPEKWKRAVDNRKVFRILLTDFSKTNAFLINFYLPKSMLMVSVSQH